MMYDKILASAYLKDDERAYWKRAQDSISFSDAWNACPFGSWLQYVMFIVGVKVDEKDDINLQIALLNTPAHGVTVKDIVPKEALQVIGGKVIGIDEQRMKPDRTVLYNAINFDKVTYRRCAGFAVYADTWTDARRESLAASVEYTLFYLGLSVSSEGIAAQDVVRRYATERAERAQAHIIRAIVGNPFKEADE